MALERIVFHKIIDEQVSSWYALESHECDAKRSGVKRDKAVSGRGEVGAVSGRGQTPQSVADTVAVGSEG